MRTKFNGILTLFLALIVQISFAQDRTISGSVSDEAGPLPGVTILKKGTTQGTETDFDGNFSIKANTGDILVFSFVGMKTQEMTVGISNTINLVLESDSLLEEVVIVGYGTAKKGKIAGSVSVVSAKEIESVPIASFDQILQGQAPGLYVTAGSGQPGSSAKVRIRGTRSINGGNSPLYVLDGVPITSGDFAALNANDFESVSVLKDAASVAIYGSRGASGVILITSKKGRYNSKTNFTYRSQYGVSEVGKAGFDVMNAFQKMTFENILTPGTWSQQDLENAKVNSTNWKDVFFRTGTVSSHELSAAGGGENSRFFVSTSYFDQQGIGLRSDLKRIQLRLNLENKASDNLTFGVNTSLGFTKSNFNDSENAVALQNPYAAVYLANPYHTLYNEDGTLNVGSGKVGGNAYENLVRNKNNSFDSKIVTNVFTELKITDNLKAKVNFGLDYLQSRDVRAARPDTNSGQNTTPGNEGFYRTDNSYSANINSYAQLTYNTTINQDHEIEASIFGEYNKFYFDSNGFTGYGINPKLFGYANSITAATADNGLFPNTRGNNVERGLLSYFMTGKYSFQDKYIFDFTVRRDASSRFSKANKWGTFWAAGIYWDLMKESFMNQNGFLNTLKLRASYGTTGNQQGIGSFQDEGIYGTSSYAGESGIAPTSIGNNKLKWEETAKLNFGLDFGFWNNRINGTIEYYIDKTSDLFINQQLSGTSGFTSIDANVGKMENRGIDVNLSAIALQSEDFSLTVNGNFNYNKNEITDLGQESEYETGTSIVRVGLPINTHYIVGWAGVNPANGQPLYLDANQNVTTTFSDNNRLAIFGSSEPVYTGSFGADIKYKNFSLSTLFTFAGDYFRFNNQSFFQENPNFAQFNLSTEMLDIWQQPGDVTNIQAAQYNREFTSKDIEDASYLRFRNVVLAYDMPSEIFEKAKFLSGVRFYVQGQNLVTWTNFTGFDPEDDNNIAQYEYPTPTTYTFGVDIKF
ncbi:SusC/RagA family TonB-linked outer membrane protein [Tenacibaculum crassostreae]|uniref:SusC/RagA family TonB-linked outer membrane protein n=1 Tax=Tenacibaculum crassostreae TaxID=502683 RepID=UPI0038956667